MFTVESTRFDQNQLLVCGLLPKSLTSKSTISMTKSKNKTFRFHTNSHCAFNFLYKSRFT